MPENRLPEQEFVAHLFAPLEGPRAELALVQLRSLWRGCAEQLGMTLPIPNTGLPTDLPVTVPVGGRDGPVAGAEDRRGDYQVIVRREHDVVNLSLVFATPLADHPTRQPRIGAALPPEWPEFARWWRQLTVGGTDALLGLVTIFQAKADIVADDVVAGGLTGPATNARGCLPPDESDAVGWWQQGQVATRRVAVWETTAGTDNAGRRLVLLAPRGCDAELGTFSWSDGGVALPPLGRYLMHAAKLRYQARVRGDGAALRGLRDHVDDSVQRVTDGLRRSGPAAPVADRLLALATAEATLASTLADLRAMRLTAQIAVATMHAAMAEPLPADAALTTWLPRQLRDDIERLETAQDLAERIRGVTTANDGLTASSASPEREAFRGGTPTDVPPSDDSVLSQPPTPMPAPHVPARSSTPHLTDRVEHRMAFGVDLVGYSARSTPLQHDAQRRVSTIVTQVLADMGVLLADTDRQDAGDGMIVVLPATIEPHRALPRLLLAWHERIAADNTLHTDWMQMRLAVAVGGFARAAIGFAGATIIEVGRLLDSDVLRAAAVDRPDAGLVALVSDRLHQDVVGEGYPGLDRAGFTRHLVETKSYRRTAWLWHGPSATPPDDEGSVVAGQTPNVSATKQRDPAIGTTSAPILVLTALELAHHAMLEHLTDITVRTHPSGTTIHGGTLPSTTQPVAIVLVGTGTSPAAVLAERAIHYLRPALTLVIGVAGGLHHDIHLGDVIVATKVYGYQGGAESPDGFRARPSAWAISHRYEHLARHVARAPEWSGRVHFRPIAVGDVVLNSTHGPLIERIRLHYNDAAAVERESSGIWQAAHLNEAHPVLTIRGISDHADGAEDISDRAGWQPRAAQAATAFTAALIRDLAQARPDQQAGSVH